MSLVITYILIIGSTIEIIEEWNKGNFKAFIEPSHSVLKTVISFQDLDLPVQLGFSYKGVSDEDQIDIFSLLVKYESEQW